MFDKNFKQQNERRPEQEKEYDQKLLDVARVVRVMAGGRRFRFRVTIAIGNRKGRVGVGVAKGADVSIAVEKAVSDAKKHLINVKIVNGTIPHQVEAKFSTAKVLLKPGIEGRGIVAGGAVRAVCNLAGIENLSGKILGKTKNKLNNARATIKALEQLKSR